MRYEEDREIQIFFEGHAAKVPLWFAVYAAAGFDPLRAQEIAGPQGVNKTWWERHTRAQSMKARAEQGSSNKAKRDNLRSKHG